MSVAVDAQQSDGYQSPLLVDSLPTDKTCSTCGRYLPLSEFPRKWRSSEVRHSDCRQCRNDYRATQDRKRQNEARYKATCRKVQAIRRLKERRQVEGLGRSLLKVFGSGEKMAAELVHAARYAHEHGYGQSALSLLQCLQDVYALSALALSTMKGEPESIALLNDAGEMPAVLRSLIATGRLTPDDVARWAEAVRD